MVIFVEFIDQLIIRLIVPAIIRTEIHNRASINFQTQEVQTSYTADLEVPQENLGSPTFSVLQQAGLCFAKHRFLFQCHTESS